MGKNASKKRGDVIITENDRTKIQKEVDRLFKNASQIIADVDTLINDVGLLVEKYGLVELK